MNNLLILPIIIPLITSLILIIFPKYLRIHKGLSWLAVISIGSTALILIKQITIDGIQTLQLGNWPAPYGISLVADMLAALLVLTTSIVVFCCLLYAFHTIGAEKEKSYFYPLVLLLLTGINSSFLTGDIFNLFVCFEVMLVASYVLISLGGAKRQLQESLKYLITNLIASTLFLVAIAYLYNIVGTLNMADISVRIASVGQSGLITTVALIFLIAFSLKAGLFLFYWLPGSYSAPPQVIAAIFAALLTKVGIYAILRIFTLIFYHDPQVTHLLIGIMAGVTMIFGALGAVAYEDIKRILTYNVIVGVGFLLAGLAAFNYEGLSGSIYYLIHDMMVKALIFLLGGTVIYYTQTSKIREVSGLIRLFPLLGWMFFIAALSLAGIPPFSGFIGKIFITSGTFAGNYLWLGAIGLFTSLMVLYSLMKIFMNCFWGYTNVALEKGEKHNAIMLPMLILTILTIALGLGAEGIASYVDLATNNLLNPSIYIEAVLQP